MIDKAHRPLYPVLLLPGRALVRYLFQLLPMEFIPLSLQTLFQLLVAKHLIAFLPLCRCRGQSNEENRTRAERCEYYAFS